MTRIHGLVAAGATLAIAACGGTDPPENGSSPRGGARAPASASESRIPRLLTGTWQAAIEPSRLVDAPAALTRERSVWRLKFLGTGGEGNGPSMFLSNDQVGEIVHSVSLSDDEITLQSDADCRRFVFVETDVERIQIRSAQPDRDCPSTLVGSVLQRPWRLVEGGPSRREPTSAEASLASREAFSDCARGREELGVVVGFRDGRAVVEPGQNVPGTEVDPLVSVPEAIDEVLMAGGQYVGLRAGVGPDVDIVFYASRRWPRDEDVELYTPLERVKDEASRKGILSWNHGDYSELAGTQEFVTVRLEGGPPGWDENLGELRVARALKHLVPCFSQAVRAADRLAPARGPSGSSG